MFIRVEKQKKMLPKESPAFCTVLERVTPPTTKKQLECAKNAEMNNMHVWETEPEPQIFNSVNKNHTNTYKLRYIPSKYFLMRHSLDNTFKHHNKISQMFRAEHKEEIHQSFYIFSRKEMPVPMT